MDLNIKKKSLLKLISFQGDKANVKNSEAVEKIDIEIIKLQEKIIEANKNELDNIKEVFITFKNQKLTNFYDEVYRKNKCDRCCYIFCCQFKKIKHL
jgi:histidinol dehydrogenase